jgi:hypothetical protein
MSLSFSGPGGSTEVRWIVYALLRDNVQHYLEGGEPSAAFAALHRIAEALGGNEVTVNARALRAEVSRAEQEVLARPAAELAVSARTRAVLTLAWPPPQRRQTLLLAEADLSLPLASDASTLDDVIGSLVRELLEITKEASESDVVTVRDL